MLKDRLDNGMTFLETFKPTDAMLYLVQLETVRGYNSFVKSNLAICTFIWFIMYANNV